MIFPDNGNIIQCICFRVIMKMENERDLDDYLLSLLDYTNGKHRQFISELKKRQGLYFYHLC